VIVPGGTPVLSVDGLTSVARPDRPERMSLPQDIRDRVQSFERRREAYLAEQKELARQLRGASDEDRQRIRDLIRDRREAWLEEAKKFREEARKRLDELKRELPRYQEALDAARERATDAVKEARKRRGSD
jgi:hypothetical protein